MTYIESHQELARHPKTRKLARLLRCSIPTAIGHLHLLWWWCMDFADDGDITRYEAADIADAMLWEDDVDTLVHALIQSGFVDQCEEKDEQRLVIHDWWDYAGMLVKRREANRERMRAARAKPELTPSPEPDISTKTRAAHVQRTNTARAGATVPNRIQPYPTQPDPKETDPAAEKALGIDPPAPTREATDAPPPPDVDASLAQRVQTAANVFSATIVAFVNEVAPAAAAAGLDLVEQADDYRDKTTRQGRPLSASGLKKWINNELHPDRLRAPPMPTLPKSSPRKFKLAV